MSSGTLVLSSTNIVSLLTPEFDLSDGLQELAAAWERLIAAFILGKKPELIQEILTFVFYWYNFMPIARGTAVCGYTLLLSLFAAAGLPVTTIIPLVSPPTPTPHPHAHTHDNR